jgi:glucokinase
MNNAMEFRYVTYTNDVPKDGTYILVADIGGTNANFGIFLEQKQQLSFILSVHYKSKQITTFIAVLHHLCDFLKKNYAIEPRKMCIAVAGVISAKRESVKPTNLNIEISTTELFAKTNFSCIYLVNDFEIIGYGIDVLDKKSLIQVNGNVGRPFATKAIIGAGTGLGKCFLIWHETKKRYVPISSEGGHTDIVLYNQIEWELHDFMIDREGLAAPLSWEDFLSGAGIQRIHRFFSFKDAVESGAVHPDAIFSNKDRDSACQKTYELYAQLYGRCAKNTALEALALGGLYIAGGIATRNIPMFSSPFFLHSFTHTRTHQALIAALPLTIIADYNVSLYGSAQFLLLEKICGE